MSDQNRVDRRSFIQRAACVAALSELAFASPSRAQKRSKQSSPSFDSLKQIRAGVLDVGYTSSGRLQGRR